METKQDQQLILLEKCVKNHFKHRITLHNILITCILIKFAPFLLSSSKCCILYLIGLVTGFCVQTSGIEAGKLDLGEGGGMAWNGLVSPTISCLHSFKEVVYHKSRFEA